jgi:hypothetical protein
MTYFETELEATNTSLKQLFSHTQSFNDAAVLSNLKAETQAVPEHTTANTKIIEINYLKAYIKKQYCSGYPPTVEYRAMNRHTS